MRLVKVLALAAITAVLIAACGGASTDGSARSDIYDFSATDLAGSTFDGDQLAGTPTVLWFWAPWCPTCRAQAPTVRALAEKHEGSLNVVGVGGQARESDIRDYAEELTGITVLIDDPGAVWRHFRVTAQSSYVVLDSDGTIVADGYVDNTEITDAVAKVTASAK